MRISTNWGKKFVFRPFDSRQLLLNKINIWLVGNQLFRYWQPENTKKVTTYGWI
jgi:hypothetical protein